MINHLSTILLNSFCFQLFQFNNKNVAESQRGCVQLPPPALFRADRCCEGVVLLNSRHSSVRRCFAENHFWDSLEANVTLTDSFCTCRAKRTDSQRRWDSAGVIQTRRPTRRWWHHLPTVSLCSSGDNEEHKPERGPRVKLTDTMFERERAQLKVHVRFDGAPEHVRMFGNFMCLYMFCERVWQRGQRRGSSCQGRGAPQGEMRGVCVWVGWWGQDIRPSWMPPGEVRTRRQLPQAGDTAEVARMKMAQLVL